MIKKDTIYCPICRKAIENTDSIFIHCPICKMNFKLIGDKIKDLKEEIRLGIITELRKQSADIAKEIKKIIDES